MLRRALALLTVPIAGCGAPAPLAQVEGTVRLDGQPLADVLVCYLPDPARGTTGPRSTGTTDEKGRYRLRCDDQRKGAVIGWHRVIVEDLACYRVPRDEASPASPAGVPSRVPAAYRAAADTPIRKQVKPGKQVVALELRSPTE